MKRKKLYMAILLFAGILTSCKVGKSYVRPDLHLPDSLAQHQDSVSFGDQDWKDIYADSTLRSLIDRALEPGGEYRLPGAHSAVSRRTTRPSGVGMNHSSAANRREKASSCASVKPAKESSPGGAAQRKHVPATMS